MGHIWVRVRIGDPERKQILEADALVDTGATLTVIPRGIAERLKLPVTGKSLVETASGRVMLERTRVWVEIEGESEIVPALISDNVEKILIGVTTLEVLGLQVDPLTGRLRKWALLLY